jgi:hypothetical protein
VVKGLWAVARSYFCGLCPPCPCAVPSPLEAAWQGGRHLPFNKGQGWAGGERWKQEQEVQRWGEGRCVAFRPACQGTGESCWYWGGWLENSNLKNFSQCIHFLELAHSFCVLCGFSCGTPGSGLLSLSLCGVTPHTVEATGLARSMNQPQWHILHPEEFGGKTDGRSWTTFTLLSVNI